MCASVRFPARGQVMLIGKPPDIPSSEITSRAAYEEYFNRRRFLREALATGALALSAGRLADLAGNMIDPRIVCAVHFLLRPPRGEVGQPGCNDHLALLRRPAHGRSHESAHAAHLWTLWRCAAQSGWRAGAHCRAMEVRLQIREVDCDREVCREDAPHHLERSGVQRIRLLLQREPQRGPPPLEPEDRTPHWAALLSAAPHNSHVQRLWRPGGLTLFRDGFEVVLLMRS